jgi:hypothetical protein
MGQGWSNVATSVAPKGARALAILSALQAAENSRTKIRNEVRTVNLPVKND